MHHLTIPRSQWLRGEGSGRSYLHREQDDRLCCVGIYLCSLGFDKSIITGVRAGHSIKIVEDLPESAQWLRRLPDPSYAEPTDAAEAIYAANDSTSMGEVEREATLVHLFAKQDIRVTFID